MRLRCSWHTYTISRLAWLDWIGSIGLARLAWLDGLTITLRRSEIGYGHTNMRKTAAALSLAIVIVALSAGSATAQSTVTTVPATTAVTTVAATTAVTTVATTAPVTTVAPATTVATTAPATTATTSPFTTTTATSSSSSGVSGSRIAVIIIIVVVGVALIAGLYFLFARNRQRSEWSSSAQVVAADIASLATAVDRGIPLLRNPTTAAQVWVDLNSRAARARGGLGSLAAAAQDQRASAATTRANQALESLLSTIDTDRALRMGPPPPSDEQLAYSEALLTQRAAELGRAAHDLESVATAA